MTKVKIMQILRKNYIFYVVINSFPFTSHPSQPQTQVLHPNYLFWPILTEQKQYEKTSALLVGYLLKQLL